jgi:hypothetical protein
MDLHPARRTVHNVRGYTGKTRKSSQHIRGRITIDGNSIQATHKLLILKWRDVRVVEGARLESVCRGNSTVGSNPTLSANLATGEVGRSVRFLVHSATREARCEHARIALSPPISCFVLSNEHVECFTVSRTETSAIERAVRWHCFDQPTLFGRLLRFVEKFGLFASSKTFATLAVVSARCCSRLAISSAISAAI